jgi:hypothetical protein
MSEKNEDKKAVTGWQKVWVLAKKYGLVSIVGTILVSAGTWAFTTIDNLKDENIALKQQMEDNKVHREAMWMRLYYYMEQQQKLGVQVEVNKQLYNILVYSQSKKYNKLPPVNIDKMLTPKSKTYEDFKKESLMQFITPEQRKTSK